MRWTVGWGALALVACGASEPPRRDEAPTPPSAEGCQSAADCHYDDACMPRACQLEPPEAVVCEESMLPAGPCVCVERHCEMQVPGRVPVREPSCAADSDCYFDDPCAPRACTTEAIPTPECVGAQPPPAECGCVDGRCELLRAMPAAGPEASCASDDECFYDDACVPTACTTERPAEVVCEESARAPGRCGCVEGRCAMQPLGPIRE